jgi:hypothetical protein
MTFSSKVIVLQDFTTDRESTLAVLRTITPATGTASPTAGLQGLQAAFSTLAPLPEKKAMIYFSSGVRRDSADQDELKATIDAAVRANVAIYPAGGQLPSLLRQGARHKNGRFMRQGGGTPSNLRIGG